MQPGQRFEAFMKGELELPFKLYLVGGAVRDMLLRRRAKDMDFVAVGCTHEQFMQAFPDAQIVGKSFPVYLVPELGEVAFARKERKLGPYHTDYEVLFDPSVTLEEDLSRRDLTINAIAWEPSKTGEPVYHDPYGGLADMKARMLRHVGPAFSEDALRVYRLARFAAQLDFKIAAETMEFAHKVPLSELTLLPAERVCEEFRKAMRAEHPARFIEELEHLGVLALHFPHVAQLRNVPAGPPEHHPEGDALTHSLMALKVVSKVKGHSEDWTEALRIATLFHDLGKGVTDPAKLPSHRGHEEYGIPIVEAQCAKLKLPTNITRAAVMACREHMKIHSFLEMRDGSMVDVVVSADKTMLGAEGLSYVCQADCLGRGGDARERYRSAESARALPVAAMACRAEHGQPIPDALQGPARGVYVRRKKGKAIARALRVTGLVAKQELMQ